MFKDVLQEMLEAELETELAEQAMASVISTFLSKFNIFLIVGWSRYYVLMLQLIQKSFVMKNLLYLLYCQKRI